MMKDDKKKQEIEETKGTEETKEEKFVTQKEFDALQDLASQLEGNYKRALADYQNLQKRVQEEKRFLIQTANKDLLLRLLPILDTLMIAQTHLKDQGLLVSINQFLDILKAEGVTKIKTVGEVFNPQIMECVLTEKGEENNVLEELRAGYMIQDTVLRAAQVKVGKGE